MEYSERLAAAVRPALMADERCIAAVAADVDAGPASDLGHWSRVSRQRASAHVLVREQTPPPEFPVSGRMALVLTDQRLRVYRRRRWRASPGRHLADIGLAQLGNVEGTYQPASGSTSFELMLILSDGTACPLHVPNSHADAGREFVRRAQALLRN